MSEYVLVDKSNEVERITTKDSKSWIFYENGSLGWPVYVVVHHDEVVEGEGSGHAAGASTCGHADFLRGNFLSARIVKTFGQLVLNEVREFILSGEAEGLEPLPWKHR